MTISPAHGWEDILEILAREPGVVMLIGSTDTGKSTLVRYLAAELTQSTPVSLVDADVGQSALCLPGTVGMRLFRSQAEVLSDYRCRSFAYLGSASPAKIILHLVKTTGRFVAAGMRDTPTVLVDTTGLIKGEFGVGLKLAKWRAVRPDHVIAIQREEECETILSLLDNVAIHRLTPSPMVQPRSPETRSQTRQRKLADFFEGADLEYLVPIKKLELLRYGQPASLVHEELPAGTVLGLNHDEETLGLAVAVETDKRSITLRTGLVSLKGVNRLIFGDVVLSSPIPAICEPVRTSANQRSVSFTLAALPHKAKRSGRSAV